MQKSLRCLMVAALFGVMAAAQAQPVEPPVERMRTSACVTFQGGAQDLAASAMPIVITVTPAYFTASTLTRAPGKTMAIPRARVASFVGGVPVPLCAKQQAPLPGFRPLWQT